jgi:hypothetical protein
MKIKNLVYSHIIMCERKLYTGYFFMYAVYKITRVLVLFVLGFHSVANINDFAEVSPLPSPD